MAKLVDLSKKPYYLDETQIEWVEKTIESMMRLAGIIYQMKKF